MTLDEFCSRFLAKRIHALNAADVFDFGAVKSAIVHRAGPFQVEFFIIRPGAGAVDPHRHPDVDSIEVGVAGAALNFNLNGRIHKIGPGDRLHVGPKDWHSVDNLPTGAAFYSVQKWLNGVTPSSVGLNWEGTILSLAGTEHFNLIKRRGAWLRLNRRMAAERFAAAGGE